MLKHLRILSVSLILLSACKEEESITPRNYPFIKSLDVHSIDETGASIDFEILQKGKAAVNSFGIEYIEFSRFEDNHNTLPPVQIEKAGTPANTIETLRIDYDLVAGREYAARPFVKSWSKIIYGEPVFFRSKGVKGPEIKEVSQSVIINSTDITITGDFFNSRLEDNSIEIPGFEDYFRIEVLTVGREEIKFRLSRNYVPFPYNDRKYSLRLTSGGKTTVMEDCFSLGYPSIESITPLVAYVGDEIRVKFNPNAYNLNSELHINYNIIPSYHYPVDRISDDEFLFLIENIPAGKYPISLRSYDFSYEYPDSLEILNSWEVYKEKSQLPSNLMDYRQLITGDKLLYWKEDGEGDFQETYIYDLKSNTVQKIAPKENPVNRGYSVLATDQGTYLYYGLGLLSNYNNSTDLHDFSRLNLNTGTWETLPSFPFKNTRVNRSFAYQEKIYVEVSDNTKFFVFDPANMSWSESHHEVPGELRYSNYQLVVKDEYLYFLAGFYNFEVYRFRLGQQPALFGSTVGGFTPKLTIQGNSLYLTYRTFRIEEINLESGVMKSVQTLSYLHDADGIPWPSSEGLLFTFLHDGNNLQIDQKIYKLR